MKLCFIGRSIQDLPKKVLQANEHSIFVHRNNNVFMNEIIGDCIRFYYFVEMCIISSVYAAPSFRYFVFESHQLIKINLKKLKFIVSNTSVEVE